MPYNIHYKKHSIKEADYEKESVSNNVNICIDCGILFCGLRKQRGSGNSGNKNAVVKMNEKYILSTQTQNNESTYIIFYSNGTGKYRRYIHYSPIDKLMDYTITFKYTYVDNDKDAVAAFYDSVIYGEKHNFPASSMAIPIES